MTQDFWHESLAAYWFSPPVALWRAVELRTAAEESFARPLLDLGCGDGLIGRVLFGPRGIDVGFDPWLAQLRRAAASGVYHHVQQALGDSMPYPSDSFATVFSNSVLEHIPDLPPVIREAGRVLRPGGRLILTVPSDKFHHLLYFYQARLSSGDSAGAARYAAQVDARLAHYHYHTPAEWADLLAQGGMRLEKARYYMPSPTMALWDRMNRRFGIGRKSLWSVLASPRLRRLGYQGLLARWVVRHYGRVWRSYYEMDVAAGEAGGGLLVVGVKQ